MFDQSARRLARRLFEDETHRRDEHLHESWDTLVGNAVGRGILGASFFHADIAKLFAGEMRARADALWDIVQRVISAAGVVPRDELAANLTEFVSGLIDEQADKLGDKLQKELMRFGGAPYLATAVGEEAVRMKGTLGAKIDLLVLELRAQAPRDPVGEPRLIQNFYGQNYGVVQAGNHTSATITNTRTTGDTKATVLALQALSDALKTVGDLPGFIKEEVSGAVEELREEVQKPQPSRLKLSQLASGVAIAVQTSAAAKPAYELVRTAFLGWGITLPPWP